MINFTKLQWRKDRIVHIVTNHQVTPVEVEEVCFGNPLILRGPGKKGKRLYYVFGQTTSGRYLFIVVKPLGGGQARPITARDMNPTQRRLYFKKR